MAFCTSCGAQMADDARFCAGCGAPAQGPTPVAGAGGVPPAPVTMGKSSALQIVLFVLVVVVVLGVLATAGAFLFGYRFLRRARIEAGPGSATVVTPMGRISRSEDPVAIAKDLGVDVYPGARSLPGAKAVDIAGFKVISARFETDDPPDKVAQFYRARFPKSEIQVRDRGRQTLVVNTSKGMIAIKVRPSGDGTRIDISNVGGGIPEEDDSN